MKRRKHTNYRSHNAAQQLPFRTWERSRVIHVKRLLLLHPVRTLKMFLNNGDKKLMVKTAFQNRWQAEYMFTDIAGKSVCLIGGSNVAVIRELNLRLQHFETKHQDKLKKYWHWRTLHFGQCSYF